MKKPDENNFVIENNFVAVKTWAQTLCCGNLNTKRGKQCHLVKTVALSMVSGLILTIQNIFILKNTEYILSVKTATKQSLIYSLKIGTVIHNVQIERGVSALYLASKGNPAIPTLLEEKYKQTDKYLNHIGEWYPFQGQDYFSSKEKYHDHIRGFRNNLEPGNTTIMDVLTFYSDDIAIILDRISVMLQRSWEVNYRSQITAYYMLLQSNENTGVERALGGVYFTEGGLSFQDLLLYKETFALGKSYLERSKEYSPDVVRILDERFTGTPLEEILTNMRSEILQNTVKPISTNLGEIWFDNMTDFIDILKDVEEYFGYNIIQRTDEDIEETQKQVTYSIIILVVVCVLLPTVAFSIHKLTNKIQQFAIALEQKACDLTEERKRTETLLYQMLPSSVAKTMMRNRSVLPEFFESVTIMFSVIVEFTDIAFRSTPMQVVDLLNTMYMTFDDLIHNYDAYKVETIGDAYMIASGLPTRNENKHVPEIAILSLDLLSATGKIKIPHMPEKSVECRIGIHTGPVVAGVVGTKMPRYCVFGDTVNTASRMESIGEARKIQITHATYTALLNSKIKFTFVRRGFIAVKGKGQMETYWLSGVDKSKSCQ